MIQKLTQLFFTMLLLISNSYASSTTPADGTFILINLAPEEAIFSLTSVSKVESPEGNSQQTIPSEHISCMWFDNLTTTPYIKIQATLGDDDLLQTVQGIVPFSTKLLGHPNIIVLAAAADSSFPVLDFFLLPLTIDEIATTLRALEGPEGIKDHLRSFCSGKLEENDATVHIILSLCAKSLTAAFPKLSHLEAGRFFNESAPSAHKWQQLARSMRVTEEP